MVRRRYDGECCATWQASDLPPFIIFQGEGQYIDIPPRILATSQNGEFFARRLVVRVANLAAAGEQALLLRMLVAESLKDQGGNKPSPHPPTKRTVSKVRKLLASRCTDRGLSVAGCQFRVVPTIAADTVRLRNTRQHEWPYVLYWGHQYVCMYTWVLCMHGRDPEKSCSCWVALRRGCRMLKGPDSRSLARWKAITEKEKLGRTTSSRNKPLDWRDEIRLALQLK